MNILINVMAIVSLVIAPVLASGQGQGQTKKDLGSPFLCPSLSSNEPVSLSVAQESFYHFFDSF